MNTNECCASISSTSSFRDEKCVAFYSDIFCNNHVTKTNFQKRSHALFCWMGKAFNPHIDRNSGPKWWSGELRTSQVLILNINTRQAGISVRVSSLSGHLTTTAVVWCLIPKIMLTVRIMTGSVWCEQHNACLQIFVISKIAALAHDQLKMFKICINYFKNKHDKNIIYWQHFHAVCFKRRSVMKLLLNLVLAAKLWSYCSSPHHPWTSNL